jgi:hypothetical protein
MVEKIAEHLMKTGYVVKYIVEKVSGVTGLVRLILVKNDGTKQIIFSNEEKDKEKGAILGYSISSKEKEILEKIESV